LLEKLDFQGYRLSVGNVNLRKLSDFVFI
jgi:hypothetical protein